MINTLFNDMIVPSIIIPDLAPDLEVSVLYLGIRLNIHVSLILLSGDLSGYHKTQIVTNRAPSYSARPHTEPESLRNEDSSANQRTIRIRLDQ